MKKQRIRVCGVWNTIALMLLLTTGFANADPSDPSLLEPYKDVGICPYKGRPEEACRLLESKIGLSYGECMVGVAKKNAEQCTPYYIQDGELVATTFTCGEQLSKASVLRAAFNEGKGGLVKPNDPKRRGLSCEIGNADGWAVLFLETCENWSAHKPPIQLMDKQPKTQLETFVQESEFLKDPQAVVSNAGFSGCCDCGHGYTIMPRPSIDYDPSDGLIEVR